MPIYKVSDKKNKEGKLQYRVRVNYIDSNGNYKQLTRMCWGSQEAKELEDTLTQQVNNKDLCNTSLTVDQLFNQFFDEIKPEVRASTYQGYEKNYRLHIKPNLANVKIKKLNVNNLKNWKKYVTDKNLSLVTEKNIYATLRAGLNYAVKNDILPVSPLAKVSNFKDSNYQEKEMQFYTPEEFQLFKTAALAEAEKKCYYDYYVFFCIAYYTGCRKGEIHALRWNCIDFKKQTLSVRKSIDQKQKGGDVEGPPKNKSSIRTMQMPQPLISVLQAHKERQQNSIPQWEETGFICGYYRCLRNTSVENENDKYAKAAGIKKIRIHDFRHSHASLLINNGVNVMGVAKRLGHSTAKETLKTYAHLFPTEEEKAISVLNSIN